MARSQDVSHAFNCAINVAEFSHLTLCNCKPAGVEWIDNTLTHITRQLDDVWKQNKDLLQMAKHPQVQVSPDSRYCPTCLLLKQGRQAPCDCGLDYCHNAYTPESKAATCCEFHARTHPKCTRAAKRALILGTVLTINCRGCDEELFLDWHTHASLHSDGVVSAINTAMAIHRTAGCKGVIS